MSYKKNGDRKNEVNIYKLRKGIIHKEIYPIDNQDRVDPTLRDMLEHFVDRLLLHILVSTR